MTITQFSERKARGNPIKGKSGKESGWLDVGEIETRGEKLYVVDFGFLGDPEEGTAVELRSGSYRGQVKILSFGFDRRVSRFRLSRSEGSGKIGQKIAEICVDTGVIAIARLTGSKKNAPPSAEKLKRAFEELAGSLKVGREKVLFARTGFGDGKFAGFELLRRGARVGIEIEFIRSKARYPFPTESKKKKPKASVLSGEKLHWAKIEDLWDPAWEAFRKGKEAGRNYFTKLSAGQSALLAIDIFNKSVLHMGGALKFFSGMHQPAVAEQLPAAYRLLDAKNYEKEFARLDAICGPFCRMENLNDQVNEMNRVGWGAEGKEVKRIEKTILGLLKSDPIENYIRRYVKAHPEDFLTKKD